MGGRLSVQPGNNWGGNAEQIPATGHAVWPDFVNLQWECPVCDLSLDHAIHVLKAIRESIIGNKTDL